MKIAILGGGGVRTPLLVREILERSGKLGLTELCLLDVDPDRLSAIAFVTKAFEQPFTKTIQIKRTIDPQEALTGADFVLTTFRPGGLDARTKDEKIPLKYGILGQETTGPGGFSMAVRSIPVLLNYISVMRKVCPQAWLVNFANPSGLLTEAAINIGGWVRTVGICDAPSSMRAFAAKLFQVDPESVYLDYFGLNHLGWVRSVWINTQNVLPGFIAQIPDGQGIPDIPFEKKLLMSLQMIPNEYLYFYYHRKESVDHILAAGCTRGESIDLLNKKLFHDLFDLLEGEKLEEIQECYLSYLRDRSRSYMVNETGRQITESVKGSAEDSPDVWPQEGYAKLALDLIESLAGGKDRLFIVNIPNRGAVTDMKPGDVVEIPAFVGKGMVFPLAVGEIPDHCLALMKQVKVYERYTIQAASQHSYSDAVAALRSHPLVGDELIAKHILDDYIQVFGADFPELR